MAILIALDPKLGLAALAVGLFGGLAFILVRLGLQSQRPRNFPPGPSTVPILGNLNVIPTTKGFLK